MAMYCALDVVRVCELDPRRVHVVCFGSPRPGNRVFARMYNERVPDTWHVINDQVRVVCG